MILLKSFVDQALSLCSLNKFLIYRYFELLYNMSRAKNIMNILSFEISNEILQRTKANVKYFIMLNISLRQYGG